MPRRDTHPFNHVDPIYDPLTGKNKPLVREKVRDPGLFQVIEEDTHANYVVCEGFDPEYNRLFFNVRVAKPYGERGRTGIYKVGEIHAAIKPKTLIGFNPMKASVSVGHPADLDEELELLRDDNGVAIAWMFIGGGSSSVLIGKLDTALAYGSTATVSIYSGKTTDTGLDIENVEPPPSMTSGTIPQYAWVELKPFGGSYFAVPLPVVKTNVTNIQVTSTGIDIKTQAQLATPVGDESSWTTIHTGNLCST